MSLGVITYSKTTLTSYAQHYNSQHKDIQPIKLSITTTRIWSMQSVTILLLCWMSLCSLYTQTSIMSHPLRSDQRENIYLLNGLAYCGLHKQSPRNFCNIGLWLCDVIYKRSKKAPGQRNLLECKFLIFNVLLHSWRRVLGCIYTSDFCLDSLPRNAISIRTQCF